jgi:peptidoglycan/LPS O-acetylase OafA/YrhL
MRIKGLDSLRFVLAMIVVFGHFGFVPLPGFITKDSLVGHLFIGFYNNLISGPAAVIVFFVISGFCIYSPFRDAASIPLRSYYTRRYIRILTPMIVAMLAALPLGVTFALFNDSILWSLLCEEIYYLIFPALLILQRRTGWRPLLITSAIFSVLVMLQNPSAEEYPMHGPALNWLLGLPCWLLGCVMAQRIDLILSMNVSRLNIWTWRLLAWAGLWITSVLRFHAGIGSQWTLNIFAVLAFFWLQREIAYASKNTPSPILEWAGKWSYSLYLIHVHAATMFALLPIALGAFGFWAARIAFILVICYAFYLLVEKPSHQVARLAGKKIGHTKAIASTA